MPRLIGLAGPAGSGKDTVAESISSHGTTIRIAFAAPLKAACQHLFDLSEAQLHDRDAKERLDTRWGLSPRQLFQRVGTDVLRRVDEEVFLKTATTRIRAALRSRADYVVVTDCRFENEAERVRDLGGRVWHLTRPANPDRTAFGGHASEAALGLQGDDFTLLNDGTLRELAAAVARQLELELGPRPRTQ